MNRTTSTPLAQTKALGLAIILAFTLTPAATAAPVAAASVAAPGTITRHSFGDNTGSREYGLYQPAGGARPGRPLIVFLHGCGGASPEEAVRQSGLTALADRHGFLVAAPAQPRSTGFNGCWSWFLPWQQQRDAGEPSIIAGITREVARRERVDPARIYVAGFSAGGAMSTVMAATYPDLYAAVATFAGCAYPTCVDGTGLLTRLRMGGLARPMPVLLGQGELDPISVYPLGRLHLRQWLNANTLSGGGGPWLAADRVDRNQYFDRETYLDPRGCALVEFLTVHGGGHTYFTGQPDYPAELTRFLLRQRLGATPALPSPAASAVCR
ncbi:extracellular catalytic domain type 1 short-chain-length polyhydroxyalkanoate depolymerase [Crossiella sp. CA198]|uniref:extracellular catalytic domain type 1 short-chain-length polyhydroxyalkanoate depolymerase n=1 Tax=Crossiella sp. CA198 TaxID=3455607 RepID=UPI003F8D5B2D